jgi:hypothetical protein
MSRSGPHSIRRSETLEGAETCLLRFSIRVPKVPVRMIGAIVDDLPAARTSPPNPEGSRCRNVSCKG